MRIIEAATENPSTPIPKRRAIATVPTSPNTSTRPLSSNSQPSPKTIILHEQQLMLQSWTENQVEKLEYVSRNNPSPGYMSLGKNLQFLNDQKESKEQQQYPYYIHCHCIGYPPAKWFVDSSCFRSEKYSNTEKNVVFTFLYVDWKNKCSRKNSPYYLLIYLKHVQRIPKYNFLTFGFLYKRYLRLFSILQSNCQQRNICQWLTKYCRILKNIQQTTTLVAWGGGEDKFTLFQLNNKKGDCRV